MCCQAGLTLGAIETFHLRNQKVKNCFLGILKQIISETLFFFKENYFFFPFPLHKLEKRNNRKGEGEDLKFKIISLIFLVLFGTHSKYSTESPPRLKILPKACKRFLFINDSKRDSGKGRK